MLDSRLKELTVSIEKHAENRDTLVEQVQTASAQLRIDTEFEFNKLKGEIEKWFELAKAHTDGQGQSGVFGKGSPHGGHKGIDKKEIAVWKFPGGLDKSSFCHWVDAVDLQLEMVHDFKHAGFVLNQIFALEGRHRQARVRDLAVDRLG